MIFKDIADFAIQHVNENPESAEPRVVLLASVVDTSEAASHGEETEQLCLLAQE